MNFFYIHSNNNSAAPACHCVSRRTGWCARFWRPWRCPAGDRRRRSCCSDRARTWPCTTPGRGKSGIGFKQSEQIKMNSDRNTVTHTHLVKKNKKTKKNLHYLWTQLQTSRSGTWCRWRSAWRHTNTFSSEPSACICVYVRVCSDSVPGEHGVVRFRLFLMRHCTDIQRCQVHS